MKSLTIVYITSRKEPQFKWFIESLRNQCADEPPRVIYVDSTYPSDLISRANHEAWPECSVTVTRPKPTVWQGPQRVTNTDWWAASNARNTGIALCQTEWIAFLDDRSVLAPGWLDGVRRAMGSNYCVAGRYEKRTGMTVENGVIQHGGIVTGEDGRFDYCRKHYEPAGMKPPYASPGEWTYGCSITLPLEWALTVNGFDENCDGMRYEDVFFGMMLANNGFPIRYDPDMLMIEDRTPAACLPVMRCQDKGVSPNDRSHWILEKLRKEKRATHGFNLRDLRASALAGQPWPAPWGPSVDPFDQQPIADFQ